MNRNRFLAVAVVGLAVVLLIWLWPRNTSRSTESQPHPTASETVTSTIAPTVPEATPSLPSETLPPPAAVKNQPDNSQQKAWATAFLTPISFWGKVVDQDGKPVPDATIKLAANDNPNPMASGSVFEKTSDAEGLFSITDAHGIALYVEVSKEGYYSTDQSRGRANYVLKNNTDLPVPTATAPAIFVLRKMGETVPLIVTKQKSVSVPKNGSPVNVNLRTGGNGEGGVKVECWTEDQNTDAQGHYNWRCRLSVPGGGLIERTGQFSFEAPASGYKPEEEITMSQSAERWNKGTNKEFFAQLPDGTYARFSFKLTTSGEHFFMIQSYVNPEPGSRSLEYDPNKTTTANQ